MNTHEHHRVQVPENFTIRFALDCDVNKERDSLETNTQHKGANNGK